MRNSYWLLKTEPEEWSWKQQVKLENRITDPHFLHSHIKLTDRAKQYVIMVL